VRNAACTALALCLASSAPRALAQLSPGPLSRSHSTLEGNGQCLSCHDPQKGVSADKCLACHSLLRQRRAGGLGLHARPEYADCKRCHVEHQGAQADLVWWGASGRAAFDHAQSGYVLAGRHARIACEACHRARLKLARSELQRGGANPGTTWLGLGTTCASCHENVHGAQFGDRDCADCHGLDAWRSVTAFDHARTAYPLTGRHATVGCAKCHPALPGTAPRRLRFKGVAFAECTACHRDPHAGRLGAACSTCHATEGWAGLDRARFDHTKTGYPLAGRHAGVACRGCHARGRPLRPSHANCTDCHVDPHFDQLARRADRGRCDACHSVRGFQPAIYSIADHEKTDYPLEGAHLAVPCNSCHRPLARAELVRASARFRGRHLVPTRFRFSSTHCGACHADPHKRDLSPQLSAAGCESCHRVSAWRDVTFDHARARFPLAGGHTARRCDECHRRAGASGAKAALKLRDVPLSCEGCHRDPHGGQLAREGTSSQCERCHTVADWRATRFDHARETSYALDGAHQRLACGACHKPAADAPHRVVYKPLPRTCKGCHGPAESPGKERP